LITVLYNNILYDDELLLVETGSGVIGVTVEGHALFSGGDGKGMDCISSPKGGNIVCAAVSFSALTLLKSVTMIAGIRPEYSVKEGLLDLRINVKELSAEKKNILRVLLESFMIGILDLKKAYPDLFAIKTIAEN
jgi:uncharacterized protein YsxB (DUF464 family)